jgi:hypothetical protein
MSSSIACTLSPNIRGRVSEYVTSGSKTAVMDVIDFLCVSLGSRTVQLRESLGSSRACSFSEAGFSSQHGDRAWVCYLKAAFCCAFFVDSMQKIFTKKCFSFMVENVCRVKRFTTGSRNSLKDVRKSQMIPAQVRNWQSQQSKDFYTAGFGALVKRWDKCIIVGGGYVEK